MTRPVATAAPIHIESSNAEVLDTIRGHHSELAEQLHERTQAVVAAAQHGDCEGPRAALHEWYQSTLLPHIVAEEQALYSAASDLDATRLLVCAMLSEHRTLVSLIADLALAQQPFETAMLAASAQAVFTVHVEKENDVLLPALGSAELDLGALLEGMHDVLGSTAASAPAPDGSAELDVRVLPHGQRHEIIFGRLDALAPGEALVIVNDHDPKPLRYQTEALWPDRFTWTYREAGPQTWRVAISRAG